MIRRVSIKGFQSLSDVSVDLGSFTVIQGRSNSGKSAFVRALRAVSSNGSNLRGTGGSFISHQASEASVVIDRELTTLRWVKSPKKTTYTLDGKVFTTGQEVPQEVDAFLGLGDLVIDSASNLKVNVNFQGGGRGQGQFETPFLVVDASGSYVAKVLSLLTSANMLYAAQALAKRRSKAASDKLKALRDLQAGRQVKIEEQRRSYTPIQTASEAAAALMSDVSAAEAALSTFDRLSSEIEAVSLSLQTSRATLSRLRSVSPDSLDEISILHGQLNNLQGLRDQYYGLVAEATEDRAALSAASAHGWDGLLSDITAISSHLDALNQWQDAVVALQSGVKQLNTELTSERTAQEKSLQDLELLMGSLDVCPTCNQKVSNS